MTDRREIRMRSLSIAVDLGAADAEEAISIAQVLEHYISPSVPESKSEPIYASPPDRQERGII
jgi:hypothetical protein